MKHFLFKVKKVTKDFFTNKSAFSLVELIVVIAIMAVMAAVLAPALLGYVERSRAQKDTSAMSEVVNSVQLSLADQDVYDEMLMYSAEQYSCYVDSDSPDEANKVDIKAGKYFMYNDNERQLDETVYKLDGVMRGVTITFAPDAAASNSATLDLIKGHVNKYLPSGKKTYGGLTGTAASPKLADIPESELYNSLRATIGDKIAISSQTYRNSEYTIFISMGTTGGQEAAAQDAIKVWGQFSGTNLPEGSSVAGNTATGSNEFKEPSNGGGVTEEQTNIIPVGSIYATGLQSKNCSNCDPFWGWCWCDVTILEAGENFPAETNQYDLYFQGDYAYMYQGEYRCSDNDGCPYVIELGNGFQIMGFHTPCGGSNSGTSGWCVGLRDRTKTVYGEILESINGHKVTKIAYLFTGHKITAAPSVPQGTINMLGAFASTNITTHPDMTRATNVECMDYAFQGCVFLTSAPKIPASVRNRPMELFDNCRQLTGVIQLPCSIYNSFPPPHQFSGCPATTEFYHIPNCDGSCGVD